MPTTGYDQVGVDFALKELRWDNVIIRIQLWDIAGQERFGSLTRVYYRDAAAAFVVLATPHHDDLSAALASCYASFACSFHRLHIQMHDLTKANSLQKALDWKRDIDEKVFLGDNTTPIPCVLLSNKCDLVTKPPLTKQEMQQFCQENGFVGWFETSAKDGTNVEASANFLIKHILD
eukprot:gene3230-3747_t